MVQNQDTRTLGDSLRSLADLLDRATPGLMSQSLYPDQPARVSMIMARAVDVESLATLLGGDLELIPHEDTVQTHLNLTVGRVWFHAIAIDPVVREVARPAAVEDPGGEGDWQLKERNQ